ncbi:MAG: hypothetical protein ACOC9T_00165 [Myxococcota bacterium]
MSKRDNAGLRDKVRLRTQARHLVEEPVVLETHGGWGEIWRYVYRDVETGTVFEKDEAKAEALAAQRPTWAVYLGECERAITAGVGKHLTYSLVDIDPYGDPWPTIDAVLSGAVPLAERLVIVVNDGLRRAIRLGRGWQIESIRPMIVRWGTEHINDVYDRACLEFLAEKAEAVGYELRQWTCFYAGHNQQMTHYAAQLTRSGGAK